MKKIMFNDRFGLTQAVLEESKTMTRRIVTESTLRMAQMESHIHNKELVECIKEHTPLCSYDKVAIAQSYHDLNKRGFLAPEWLEHTCESSAGYENKMFVRADLMPHRIIIRKVDVQRLQSISDEDCLREGIKEYYPYIDRNPNDRAKSYRFIDKKSKYGYYQLSPVRDCFAEFINRVSGKGTWERNPWVFVYEFELIE